MQPPEISVLLFRASEVAQTKAGFRPPHVLTGAMDFLEHHSLIEFLKQHLAKLVMIP